MGNKYVVTVWVKDEGNLAFNDYKYKSIYRGEWFLLAAWHLLTGKKKHKSGCARLEFRS